MISRVVEIHDFNLFTILKWTHQYLDVKCVSSDTEVWNSSMWTSARRVFWRAGLPRARNYTTPSWSTTPRYICFVTCWGFLPTGSFVLAQRFQIQSLLYKALRKINMNWTKLISCSEIQHKAIRLMVFPCPSLSFIGGRLYYAPAFCGCSKDDKLRWEEDECSVEELMCRRNVTKGMCCVSIAHVLSFFSLRWLFFYLSLFLNHSRRPQARRCGTSQRR